MHNPFENCVQSDRRFTGSNGSLKPFDPVKHTSIDQNSGASQGFGLANPSEIRCLESRESKTPRSNAQGLAEGSHNLAQNDSPKSGQNHNDSSNNNANQTQIRENFQKPLKEPEIHTQKVLMALNDCRDQNQQEIDKIQNLLKDGSLTSEVLFSVHKNVKEQVKLLVDAGVHPADIEVSDGNIAIKQKSNEAEIMGLRDKSKDKKILDDFGSKHRGKSITDILEQANKDHKVLDALVDSTVNHLKNALKLSADDMSHYESKVRDIYAHHDVRVSDAHTLYQYYDLQRRKDELKPMVFGKKQCKQAYNIMSLNACQNRRYKKEVTKVLEAEELRRKHLVEKYGNLKLEKGGKRGKEKRMLDDLIKARKEKTETDRAFELFNTLLEKSERNIINDKDLTKDEREKRKDILKSTRENFDRLYQHKAISQVVYTIEKNRISQEHFTKKYGSHPLYGRLNDVASDGGAVLGVTSTVVGWTTVVPFVAA